MRPLFRQSFGTRWAWICLCIVTFAGMDCSGKMKGAGRQEPRVFILDSDLLSTAKERIGSGDPALAAALKNLQSQADKALKAGPFSVMFKKPLPPSGDRHDYMSLAPYWWPDPDSPNGLPYIRHDGKTNPAREQFDKSPFWDMEAAVTTLALAYYFTGHEPYAVHAARLIRTWFLDEDTRMNPHLKYGQFIPGICEGRGGGIIDARPLFRIADAVGLLEGSDGWTEQDREKLVQWYDRYLDWLLHSEIGKSELEKENNHGTWCEVQVSAIALFLGKTELARDALKKMPKRIAWQVEPDGRQPLETVRTRAFHYSSMNVEGLFDAAALGEKVGLDLWHFSTKDGRSMRSALDYLLAFAVGRKTWPYPMIRGWEKDLDVMAVLCRRAFMKYGEPGYGRSIGKLAGVDTLSWRFQLLYPYIQQ
jgi:hypothetical protein